MQTVQIRPYDLFRKRLKLFDELATNFVEMVDEMIIVKSDLIN